jgi:hypothetical protein
LDEERHEPAPQLEEPALARKRVDGDSPNGHGTWQPA